MRFTTNNSRTNWVLSFSLDLKEKQTFPQVIFAISIDNTSDWLHRLPDSVLLFASVLVFFGYFLFLARYDVCRCRRLSARYKFVIHLFILCTRSKTNNDSCSKTVHSSIKQRTIYMVSRKAIPLVFCAFYSLNSLWHLPKMQLCM